MSTSTHQVVQKLWSLCNILRDAGVTYGQYVTEITYLLFLKMCDEKETEDLLPEGCRWSDLKEVDEADIIDFYQDLLTRLSREGSEQVKKIFQSANSRIEKDKYLKKLITNLDALDWYDATRSDQQEDEGYDAKAESLADLYEGLLEKNATESKSGAGQYFTPRALINVIVQLVNPQPGEVISDPAAGTFGFLIAANAYMKKHHNNYFDLSEAESDFQRCEALCGVELVPDTARLAMMNALLHKIEGKVIVGDTLTSEIASKLPLSDVVLANPPFGTKRGGGGSSRDDFTFTTSNKQLAFLMHIYRNLKKGGRAAVVLPDNVLFEDKTGQKIREDLMNKCNLHTILRLPTGIFYAQGVKTNVLFFQRGHNEEGNTQDVWIYDLRTNMPSFGKRTPFTEAHLEPFIEVFGADPNGSSKRVDQGEEGRFRRFTRDEIRARGDNLDITWLRDDSVERVEDLPDPDEIAAEIMTHLQNATEEMQALMELLSGGASEEGV